MRKKLRVSNRRSILFAVLLLWVTSYFVRDFLRSRVATDTARNKILGLSRQKSFLEASRVADKIMARNEFIFLMFINEAYLSMTKSWVCNMLALDANVLSNTLIYTDDTRAARRLFIFGENNGRRLNVYSLPTSTHGDVAYGTYEYFALTLHRLELQDALIQAGHNVMLIEADAVWFSREVNAELKSKFRKAEIFSADNSVSPEKFHEFSAGFSGYRGKSPSVRELFSDYTISYAAKLSQFAFRKGNVGNVGEQLHLMKLIKKYDVKVLWLDDCFYVPGFWYRAESGSRCFGTRVLQNNYIVGNREKVNRAKSWRHWFLAEDGKTCAKGDFQLSYAIDKGGI